ncbi:MAG: Ig-like domain-containing protein [Oscillospiraceae bacterium]|nr:Ig-like domain-containing protein [Oscillospiraceae bacterium]
MKRFLSMVLTLALICTMLPTVFASEGEAAEAPAEITPLKYNFGYEAYGATSDIPMKTNFTQDTAAVGDEGYVADTVSIARYSLDKKLATVNTSPWFFAGMKYVYDSAIKSGELWVQAYRTRTTVTTYGFMIAIDVPVAGEYIPTLNYQALEKSYINNILLVPEDDSRLVEKITNKGGIGFWRTENESCEGTDGVSVYLRDLRDVDRENYQLGTLDMQETVFDEEIETKTFDSVTLQKKRYYLIFDCDGQTVDSESTLGKGNKIEISLRSFELNLPVLETVDVSFGSNSIYVNEAAKAKLALKFDTGKEFTDEYTVAYESMNDCATVDSKGIVTGVSEGTAKIKVTVTPKNYGDPISVEATIPVVKRSADEAIKYNFGYGAYGVSDVIPMATTAAADTASVGGEGYVADTLSLARFDTDGKWANIGTAPWRVDGMHYVNTMQLKENELWIQAWKIRLPLTSYGFMMMIDVPVAGEYIPTLEYQALANGYINNIILIPEDDPFIKEKAGTSSPIGFWNTAKDPAVLEGTAGATAVLRDMGTTIRDKYQIGTVDMQEVTPDDESEYKEFKAVTLEKKRYCLFIDSAETQTTDSSGNYIELALRSFELDPVTVSEKVEKEFDYTEEEFIGGGATLRAFAIYGAGGEDSEEDIIETREITLGETVSVSAPVSVTRGDKTYNFLYWAKGATNKKQIVSYNASFTYKAYAEANNLIAVYKEAGAESSAKEYYNANGQLMDGDTLPSLPGYGQATGWADAGNGVYVAEYAPLQKNIKITVNGAEESYAYGDNVVCTANAPEGKVFMYWTKNDEIVSTESTYTFSAWETATVTAVYGDSAPTLGKTMRKILLGTLPAGEDTAVMAEFIGFSDAVEKGIIFGGKKIPMLTDKSQFTLTNDTDGTVEVTGYAIVSDNGTLKEVSDGSISVE